MPHADTPRPADQAAPAAGTAGLSDAPWWHWVWLWPPVVVGVVLRFFRLPAQVILGDELHAVRAAQRLDLGEILTTYLPSDASLPLTAYVELLLENGVTLAEHHLRLPVLVAGLLLLVVVPVAVARRLGPGVGMVAAWLTALSPGLVLYGRIARSYAPTLLFAFVAVMAFERWWRTRRLGAALAYVVCGGLAVWFHLVAAPFVVAPLAWAALAALGRRSRWRDLGLVILVGVALAAAFATFLVPARESFLALFADKAGYEAPGLSAWKEIAWLQAGATGAPAAVLFWALAAVGLGSLLRHRFAFASYSLLLVAVNPLAAALMQPLGWANPLIFNRYLLAGLPLVLTWAAAGVAVVAGTAARRVSVLPPRATLAAATALVLAGLAWGGPWHDPRVLYSSFLHGDGFVRFSAPRIELRPAVKTPAAYRWLADQPPDKVLVEYTAMPSWIGESAVVAFQHVHRHPVLLSVEEEDLFAGFAPATYVRPTADALLASPGHYLLLHKRAPWELDRVKRPRGVFIPEPLRPISEANARRLGQDLVRRWGAPDFEDDLVQGWDLERVRGGRR